MFYNLTSFAKATKDNNIRIGIKYYDERLGKEKTLMSPNASPFKSMTIVDNRDMDLVYGIGSDATTNTKSIFRIYEGKNGIPKYEIIQTPYVSLVDCPSTDLICACKQSKILLQQSNKIKDIDILLDVEYIDVDGNKIINETFQQGSLFKNDRAIVQKKDGTICCIDRKGNVLDKLKIDFSCGGVLFNRYNNGKEALRLYTYKHTGKTSLYLDEPIEEVELAQTYIYDLSNLLLLDVDENVVRVSKFVKGVAIETVEDSTQTPPISYRIIDQQRNVIYDDIANLSEISSLDTSDCLFGEVWKSVNERISGVFTLAGDFLTTYIDEHGYEQRFPHIYNRTPNVMNNLITVSINDGRGNTLSNTLVDCVKMQSLLSAPNIGVYRMTITNEVFILYNDDSNMRHIGIVRNHHIYDITPMFSKYSDYDFYWNNKHIGYKPTNTKKSLGYDLDGFFIQGKFNGQYEYNPLEYQRN